MPMATKGARPERNTAIAFGTPMGANLVEGGATFRVWAPSAREVHVLGEWNNWQRSPDTLLAHDDDGTWSAFVPGPREFQQYKYYVVGRGSEGFKRDPYARELTADWPNSNCVLRRPDFPWHDADFRTPDFSNLVIYQLHVGTFNTPAWPARAGTFLDVAGRLEHLDALGVTAVQLLPIVEFRSRFSMGYNGTDYFSPEMDFGVPDPALTPYLSMVNRLLRQKGCPEVEAATLRGAANQLKMLVDLCHLYGMAVIFDVVYNHAGGDFGDESLYFFDRDVPDDQNRSLYFTDQGHAGGLVFAFWKREVRQFLIDNASFFLREYHADGFRYDQVSVIIQEGGENGFRFCQDLTSTTGFLKPESLDHAEHWPPDPFVVRPAAEGGAGFDTVLHDSLRNTLRHAVDQASYPGDFPLDMGAIGSALRPGGFDASWRVVQCVEDHDEVYRERGLRIPALADHADPRSWYARSRSRAVEALLYFAPGIPMLFMGQEFLEERQWADDIENHPDLLLEWRDLEMGDAVRLDHLRFTRDALAVRFRFPALRGEGLDVFHTHDENRVLAFHRWVPGAGGDVVVVLSLRNESFYDYRLGFPEPGAWAEVFNSDAYDHWVNPWTVGNTGAVTADGPPLHGLGASASIRIPANGVLVFAR